MIESPIGHGFLKVDNSEFLSFKPEDLPFLAGEPLVTFNTFIYFFLVPELGSIRRPGPLSYIVKKKATLLLFVVDNADPAAIL